MCLFLFFKQLHSHPCAELHPLHIRILDFIGRDECALFQQFAYLFPHLPVMLRKKLFPMLCEFPSHVQQFLHDRTIVFLRMDFAPVKLIQYTFHSNPSFV